MFLLSQCTASLDCDFVIASWGAKFSGVNAPAIALVATSSRCRIPEVMLPTLRDLAAAFRSRPFDTGDISMLAHHARHTVDKSVASARFEPLNDHDEESISTSVSQLDCSCLFHSQKADAPLCSRNQSERDLVTLLEADPLVTKIESIPYCVVVVINGEERRHVPALRVHSVLGCSVLDVVPAVETASPARAALTLALTAAHAANGVRYAVIPEQYVQMEPRLSNVRYALYWGMCAHVFPETEQRVVQLLIENGACTISEILSRLHHRSTLLETLCGMAMSGQLELDVWAPEPTAMKASLTIVGNHKWHAAKAHASV